jgi:hypothetical protein
MGIKFVPKHDKVVLFRTHFWDQACAVQVSRLRAELAGLYDVVVLGYQADGVAPPTHGVFYSAADFAEFASPSLHKFQLAPLRFYCAYPGYAHYWAIEYDVRYTGDWRDLFADLGAGEVDLYGTSIQRRAENPGWWHWRDFSTGRDRVRKAGQVKMFTPLLRLSNVGFAAIRGAYRRGWAGHYEALWPTAVEQAGLVIEDIGGFGSFTPPARRGCYYSANPADRFLRPGSFTFRPSMLEADIPDGPPLLWHPVKTAAMAAPLPADPSPGWRESAAWDKFRRLRLALVTRQGS